MHRIVVCSAYQGLDSNLVLARIYCRYLWDQDSEDNRPFAPHLFYPQFLNEHDPEERKAGLELGKEEIFSCGHLAVFVRNDILTPGMIEEIEYAIQWISSNNIYYFDATDIEDIVEMKHLDKTKVPTKAQLQGPKTYATDAKDKLAEVAKALREGKRYEDLQTELESFLGPLDASSEQDVEADLAWETEYRNGR